MTTPPSTAGAPATPEPPVQTTAPGDGSILNADRSCFRCSYNLRGLPIAGVCPECGTPVQDSLRGILLQFASAEYLSTIHSGLSLILNGILLMVLLSVVSIFIGINASGVAGGDPGLVLAGLQIIPSVMMLLGYWKYTEPDPGFAGTELPAAARKVMRVTVVIQAATTAAGFLLSFATIVFLAGGAATSGASAVLLVVGIVNITGIGAFVVQFFATMRYTRWMASRVPDARIITRTKTYMWALPAIAIVGAIFLFLGPLIALVLYWNLLDRLRKHVKAIRKTGSPAALKGSLG